MPPTNDNFSLENLYLVTQSLVQYNDLTNKILFVEIFDNVAIIDRLYISYIDFTILE